MELSQIEKQIEDAIETLRRNGQTEPFKFECNEEVYHILEQSPYVDKVGKGLHYFSKIDGTKVYVPKPIDNHDDMRDYEKWFIQHFSELLEKAFIYVKPFPEHHFEPIKWNEKPMEIKFHKIELNGEEDRIKQLIESRKNREIYIPKKLKRDKWNAPFNKK